ncbi:hypothetical protein [Pseudomonas aeruginosa]|uniref:hypothetical protein n=1 Tax=Pseudomonas aeruginosa TaxID=287 RepID=UPI002A6A87C3|nr:hypothetical protein [Pseudomonas aeruginosa]MCT0357511.1 hypothetical protein [Pseudomonas aeruginosa]MCT0387792.1 hypothetical protein [Pseudomonas aeruginosa]MDY1346746.1 hypothetical protein [Pseudomonas aeruginosa]
MTEPSIATIRDEVLIAEHLATAQRLRIQIHTAHPFHKNARFGDWAVTGVFENQDQYVGPLSELGLQLVPSAGLATVKSLPGHRSLMPEAYKALQALKDQTAAVTLSRNDPAAGKSSLKQAQQTMQECQPWTNWIVQAVLKKGQVVPITDTDEHWLENEFAGFSATPILPTHSAPCEA